MKKIKLGPSLWDERIYRFTFYVCEGCSNIPKFLDKNHYKWEAEYSIYQNDKYTIDFGSKDQYVRFIQEHTEYIDDNLYLCIPTGVECEKDHKEFDPSTLVKYVDINEKKRIVTIVWQDGQITQGKCCEGDTFDPEKGIAIAWMKRPFSSTASMKRWMNKEILKSDIKYSAKKGYCKRYSGENAVEEMFKDLNKEDENAR